MFEVVVVALGIALILIFGSAAHKRMLAIWQASRRATPPDVTAPPEVTSG